MKKKYHKPELTKYLSVSEITNAHFSDHGSNVSEGANRTLAVDDCADGKAKETDFLAPEFCLTNQG